MNEKAYKTMSRSGAGALTVGIIMMVAGLVCGIIAVVSGARLLHDKKETGFFRGIYVVFVCKKFQKPSYDLSGLGQERREASCSNRSLVGAATNRVCQTRKSYSLHRK